MAIVRLTPLPRKSERTALALFCDSVTMFARSPPILPECPVTRIELDTLANAVSAAMSLFDDGLTRAVPPLK